MNKVNEGRGQNLRPLLYKHLRLKLIDKHMLPARNEQISHYMRNDRTEKEPSCERLPIAASHEKGCGQLSFAILV